MEVNLACRMCAGITDPGVSLLHPSQQLLAKWMENNLNVTVSDDNGLSTRVCVQCIQEIGHLIMIRKSSKRATPPSTGIASSSEPTVRFPASPQREQLAIKAAPPPSPQPNKKAGNIKPTLTAIKSTSQTMLEKWMESKLLQTEKNKLLPVESSLESPKKEKGSRVITLPASPDRNIKQRIAEKAKTDGPLRQARLHSPSIADSVEPQTKARRLNISPEMSTNKDMPSSSNKQSKNANKSGRNPVTEYQLKDLRICISRLELSQDMLDSLASVVPTPKQKKRLRFSLPEVLSTESETETEAQTVVRSKAGPNSKKLKGADFTTRTKSQVSDRPQAAIESVASTSGNPDGSQAPESAEENFLPPPVERRITKRRKVPEFVPVEIVERKPDVKISPEEIAGEMEHKLQLRQRYGLDDAVGETKPAVKIQRKLNCQRVSSKTVTAVNKNKTIKVKNWGTKKRGPRKFTVPKSEPESDNESEDSTLPETVTTAASAQTAAPAATSTADATEPSALPPQVLASLPTNQPFAIMPVVQGDKTFYLVHPLGTSPPMLSSPFLLPSGLTPLASVPPISAASSVGPEPASPVPSVAPSPPESPVPSGAHGRSKAVRKQSNETFVPRKKSAILSLSKKVFAGNKKKGSGNLVDGSDNSPNESKASNVSSPDEASGEDIFALASHCPTPESRDSASPPDSGDAPTQTVVMASEAGQQLDPSTDAEPAANGGESSGQDASSSPSSTPKTGDRGQLRAETLEQQEPPASHNGPGVQTQRSLRVKTSNQAKKTVTSAAATGQDGNSDSEAPSEDDGDAPSSSSSSSADEDSHESQRGRMLRQRCRWRAGQQGATTGAAHHAPRA